MIDRDLIKKISQITRGLSSNPPPQKKKNGK